MLLRCVQWEHVATGRLGHSMRCEPPLRSAAGTDAVGVFEARAQALPDQANAHRELASSLAHNDA
jgi:hypothetical protein